MLEVVTSTYLDEVPETLHFIVTQCVVVESFRKLVVELDRFFLESVCKKLLYLLKLFDSLLLYFDSFLFHANPLQVVCLVDNRLFETTLRWRFLRQLH